MRALAVLLLATPLATPLVLGCATAEPKPTREQACHGTAINLDRVASICDAPPGRGAPPSPAALEAELRPTPLHVQQGEVLEARVRLTNTTAAPLEADIGFGCLAFTANALRDDGTLANHVDGDSVGGLCGAGPSAHVTLEPGGWVEKSFSFTAAKTRMECPPSGDSKASPPPCREARVGDMDPGSYRLQVTLPFRDAVPGKAGEVSSRFVEGQVEVTRPPTP